MMLIPALRDVTLRAACASLRLYFHHSPFSLGKRKLWDGVVRPYLLWRSLQIDAPTRFGAHLVGAFPDIVHGYTYFFGVWEPMVTAIYRSVLREGDVVVDVGANVGVHVLLASKLVGPSGRVHAVEASSGIFRRLERNLRANKAGNVSAYNVAATDVPCTVPVFLHDEINLGGTTILATEAAKIPTTQEGMVEGRPLSDIVPQEDLLAARLIKIDVEGAELMVVKGLRDILPLLRPDVQILVEVNRHALESFGSSVQGFLDLFADAGFEPFEIPNGYQSSFYIKPPKVFVVPLRNLNFDMADILFRRTTP